MSAASLAPVAAPPETDFHALYREHFGYVFNVLRRLVSSPADAEDLSHETFLTAYKRLPTYDRSRPIQPWLFGIAYRVASDFRRSTQTRREVLTDPPDLEDESANSEAHVIAQQRRKTVMVALEELDLDDRAAIVSCDLESLSGPEAAEALQLPLNTLYSRLRAARQKFAAAIRRQAVLRGEA